MSSKFSAKLVSLFLVFSVSLLGYVSMSTWGALTPTAGKVAISDQVQIKQGADVTYYFADDAYLDKLEVRASYVEINSQFRLSTGVSTGQINVTLERYSVSSSMLWTADPGSADPIVTFTLSGLESGRMYRLYVDGVASSLLTATGGTISFTYSGPWSEHQFEIVATSITGSISPLVNLIFIMFGIGVVVGVIVEGTYSLRKKEMLNSQEMIKSVITMVIYIVIGIASLGILYSVVA
jgi:uncharacterized membrane protein YuzA (DUF378 family)